MSARWFLGDWLGRKSGTEEHVVMTEGAAVRVRAIREIDQKISLEDFKVLVAIPSDPMATRRLASSACDRTGCESGEEVLGGEEHMPKRVHITKQVVERFGPTRGCRKCRGMVNNDKSYRFVHHSEDCRTRREKAMREDEDFRDKAMRAESRRSARMSELAE